MSLVNAESGPPGMTLEDQVEMYRRMYEIRCFEEDIARLYRDGEVPGFVHLSVGQEATAVGACWPLRPTDVITSTHRGHGHCLAKGIDSAGMFAELMARSSGTNMGRGGSMHVADPRRGVFGANGIVAGGIPIAVGAATAMRIRRTDGVVVAFFGDGAVAQGAFHESANLAAVEKLPVVFFCENNGWAEFSAATAQHPSSMQDRARGYGMQFESVDGRDVAAVSKLMSQVVDSARAGKGPWLVEAEVHRFRGHFEGDQQKYRETEVSEQVRDDNDPLVVARATLRAAGVTDTVLDGIEEATRSRLEAELAAAQSEARPSAATLFDHVRRVGGQRDEVTEIDTSEQWRVMDALNAAMREAMSADESVFLVGVDVGEAPFAITRGLRDAFGASRVRDTPISETAVVGTAVGAAMAGMRPIAEIMYMDFLGVCFDQILNQMAKLNYMTSGNAPMSLVLRTQFGAGRSSGSQHSQSLEALLAHIPGLTVVMPSSPADAYGLLRAAIADPNPVIFVEHRLMYGFKGPRAGANHFVPLGKAAVVREGTDVTVVSYSRMLRESLAAAETLAQKGISAEVIDLRTIAPIDWETLERSLAKTSRLVVAHEAVVAHGVGAEIAARAASDWFWMLDAPVGRVGAEFTPPPYAPEVEQRWLPNAERIAEAVERTVRT